MLGLLRASAHICKLGLKLTGLTLQTPLTCYLNVNIRVWRRLWAAVSCTALFPRLGSSPLALALHFLLRAARWTFLSSCNRARLLRTPAAFLRFVTVLLWHVLLLRCCWSVSGLCYVYCVCVKRDTAACSSLSLVLVTSINRGRFLLSVSPAYDVSGLDVQRPPLTVQLQQLYSIDTMLLGMWSHRCCQLIMTMHCRVYVGCMTQDRCSQEIVIKLYFQYN